MKYSASAAIGATLLLVGCKATTHLPVSREVFDLHISTDELVCHVRNISKAQHLSFHYGTSQQPFGTMSTFRLIGDRFEITLTNNQRQSEYDLRAYDKSGNSAARSRTEKAFAAFKTALLEQPPEGCRS